MAIERHTTPTGTQTIETGFGLRNRKTGGFLHVHVSEQDYGPDDAVLTADDSHPLYLADTADMVAEVLAFGGNRRHAASVQRPALGVFKPEELEPVRIRKVVTVDFEVSPTEVPEIFLAPPTEYCMDIREKPIEEMLGHVPELTDGCTRFVAHFVRVPEDGIERFKANLGRKIYLSEQCSRFLLGLSEKVPDKWAKALNKPYPMFVLICGS